MKEEDEDEDEDDDYCKESPDFIPPSPDQFVCPPAPTAPVRLEGRTVQVIVKFADIHLTPDHPKYDGGSWHVEGMQNEAIVASGIYYSGSENISESRLHFRSAGTEPQYNQNDHDGVYNCSGLSGSDDGIRLNQEWGSIVPQADRCIAFPNTYQHRVAPFELVDKTKPGVRKILVFFLVDPTIHITATRYVPPQQPDWKNPVLRTAVDETMARVFPSALLTLSPEYLGDGMSVSQAKEHRERLMAERSVFVKKNTKDVFCQSFSLCEQ